MTSLEDVVRIIEKSGGKFNKSPVPHDVPLSQLGLDSLDVFNALNEIEVATGVSVPDAEVEKLQTISDIHAFINGNT